MIHAVHCTVHVKRSLACACLETMRIAPGRPWASRRGGRRERGGEKEIVGAVVRSHAKRAVMFRLCCRCVLAKVTPVY